MTKANDPAFTKIQNVQRRISLSVDIDSSPIGIGDALLFHVREIQEFGFAFATVQVHTPGLGLSIVSCCADLHMRRDLHSYSSVCNLEISDGNLIVGAGKGTDIFLLPMLDYLFPGPLPKAIEILVSIKGYRRLTSNIADQRRGRPAAHSGAAPREGDELSEARAAALSLALSTHGMNLDDVLGAVAFEGSGARRACRTFINPRKNRVSNKVETIEQAAARCAQQVRLLPSRHASSSSDT